MATKKILRAPGKAVTLKSTHPNVGVAVAYQKRIDRMVDAMHKSLLYWLTAAYKANEPHALMAKDASPAVTLGKVMTKLARRWTKAFDQGAADMAKAFADSVFGASDAGLKSALKKAGFTVPFRKTAAMNDAYQAVIGENISLIKSIPAKHLQEVEGLVMRSVQTGRDLGQLRDDLIERYDITKKRAALISRTENNKATATMERARRLELGITKAKWLHSGGGVHPRPSHVKASGKIYDVAQGCLIDGEYVQPGELINCRCVSRAVIPGFDDDDED